MFEGQGYTQIDVHLDFIEDDIKICADEVLNLLENEKQEVIDRLSAIIESLENFKQQLKG